MTLDIPAAGSKPSDRHIYRVTYWTGAGLTRSMNVTAGNTQEARAQAKLRDPQYIATVKTPRIVGEAVYRRESDQV